MADITRAKKRRTANKNVVLGLMEKTKVLMYDDYDEEVHEELGATRLSILPTLSVFSTLSS